ncbi:MAG: phosphoadenylyl-sulfate reductase [Planctomycetes bacterium]|nr:phosphoadenylyl-sulfate reductase [Planctomycetota bacterium]
MTSQETPVASVDVTLLDELQAIAEPAELVRQVFRRFGPRAAIGTSGQLTGSVLVDMASRAGVPFRVFAVDTLRLHPETYEIWQRLEKRYGIQIERYRPDPARLDAMVRQHGEFLFFDSKPKQELCCNVRKVEPHEVALATLDAWIAGLRRDQSEGRKATARLEIIERADHRILKVCPLADWNEAQVRAYIQKQDVPYNRLFDPLPHGARYASLGCAICTTPVLPHESHRAGRWRWFNTQPDDKKECGIHLRPKKL